MHEVCTNQSNCQSSLPSESSDSNPFFFFHHAVSHHRLARTSADILCVQDSNISEPSVTFGSNTACTGALINKVIRVCNRTATAVARTGMPAGSIKQYRQHCNRTASFIPQFVLLRSRCPGVRTDAEPGQDSQSLSLESGRPSRSSVLLRRSSAPIRRMVLCNSTSCSSIHN